MLCTFDAMMGYKSHILCLKPASFAMSGLFERGYQTQVVVGPGRAYQRDGPNEQRTAC